MFRTGFAFSRIQSGLSVRPVGLCLLERRKIRYSIIADGRPADGRPADGRLGERVGHGGTWWDTGPAVVLFGEEKDHSSRTEPVRDRVTNGRSSLPSDRTYKPTK